MSTTAVDRSAEQGEGAGGRLLARLMSGLSSGRTENRGARTLQQRDRFFAGEGSDLLGEAEERLPADHDAGGDFRGALVLPLPDDIVTHGTLPLGQRPAQIIDARCEPPQIAGHGRSEEPFCRISLAPRERIRRDLSGGHLEHQEAGSEALAARYVLAGRDDQPARIVGRPAATVCAHPRTARSGCPRHGTSDPRRDAAAECRRSSR